MMTPELLENLKKESLMTSIWAGGGGGNQISPWDPLISHLLWENCLPFLSLEKR